MDAAGQLSEAKILIQVVGLIIAGNDTTRAGLTALVSLLLQHRDQWQAVCAELDRFDIRRNDHPRWSVSFGGGPHRCLGEALARAEMEEALLALTERLPDLRLVGAPPRIKGHTGIRGVSPTHLAWS